MTVLKIIRQKKLDYVILVVKDGHPIFIQGKYKTVVEAVRAGKAAYRRLGMELGQVQLITERTL